MKGNDHMHLRDLVHTAEHRRLTREAGAATMAVLGLIGFGAMIVPVFFSGSVFRVPSGVSAVAVATTTPDAAFTDVHLIGKSAIVYDLTTKQVLFDYNAHQELPLASLTKLITIYAATGALSPASTVVITPTAAAQYGDAGDEGLAVGQRFAFEDIARLALVASSNEAAAAIAEAAAQARSTSSTDLLASAIASAGLTQTRANNGTGLDESTDEAGAYGSAQDVALLAGELLARAPNIVSATTQSSITVRDSSGTLHSQPNTNQGIMTIPDPLLSKTGYTDLAGGNLAVVFDAGIGHPVAVVVLGSTADGRFADVNELIGRTLDHFSGVAPAP